MDRCHRIGQRRPVLVLRLATAHSVEGKLLRRARSKLALERLVIKKGAFLPGETVRARMPSMAHACQLPPLLPPLRVLRSVPAASIPTLCQHYPLLSPPAACGSAPDVRPQATPQAAKSTVLYRAVLQHVLQLQRDPLLVHAAAHAACRCAPDERKDKRRCP